MIGQKFGSLTVLEKVKTKNGRCWKCICDCGNIYFGKKWDLTRPSRPISCGCYKRKTKPTKIFLSKFSEGLPNECWEWKGNFNKGGYGKQGAAKLAHRMSYEYYKGEIQKGMQVCHTCDNRKCVNPHHLFLGSITDNMKDKVKKKRHAKGSQVGSSVHTEEQVLHVRKLRLSGLTYDEIVNETGLSWDWVRKVCKNQRWQHVPLGEKTKAMKQIRKHAIGEKASSKLKESQVYEIKVHFKNGNRVCDIVDLYSVKESTLWDIFYEKTWKHVNV